MRGWARGSSTSPSFRFATTQRLEARIEAFNAFNWFRPGEVNVNPTTNQSPVTNLSSPLLAGICGGRSAHAVRAEPRSDLAASGLRAQGRLRNQA